MAFLKSLFQSKDQGVKINSPLKGELIPLQDVKDQAFASLALGQGMAVKPVVGELYAPVDGKVTAMFPTNHAIGITTDSGIELLLHIGMDTVQLEGKYFTANVKENEEVKSGQLLITFDLDQIQKEGYELDTPVVVTNSDSYEIQFERGRSVSPDDLIMTVVNKK